MILNIDQLIDYGHEHKFAYVCGAGIVNQEPAVPYGSSPWYLGSITASSYPIKFASISMNNRFKEAGYYMMESLSIRNSKGKVVYTYSQVGGNNSGIKYDLNNLPGDTYTIAETVSLHDSTGKMITSNTNEIMVDWNPIDPCTFRGVVNGVESTTKTNVKLYPAGSDTPFREINVIGSEEFTFYNIEPGNYTLKATAEGYQDYSRDLVLGSGEFNYTVNIEDYFTASGQISGVESTTQTTVELLHYKDGKYVSVDSVTVTGNGTYLFEGLYTGVYQVKVSANGYIPKNIQRRVESSITYDFAMETPKFTSFEYEFEAYAGDYVTLSWKTNFTPVRLVITRIVGSKHTNFEIENPTQTTYDVKLNKTTDPDYAIRVWYGNGANDYIYETATIHRKYGVYVKTDLIDNQYHSGEATLTLQGESEPRYTTTWTDGYHALYGSHGIGANAFAFNDVRPGTYTLKIYPDGFSAQETTVTVGSTDVTTKDFYMKYYCTGTISGVKDTDVTTVTLWKKNSDGTYTKTDYTDTVTGNDNYSIQMIDQATYRVVATCPGYVENITAKELTESGSRHFTMTLSTEPAFTKQPLSGEVAVGGRHTVTWETNFEPTKQILLGYKNGAANMNQNLDNTATTVTLSASYDYYIIRSYYNNTQYVSSNKIYITEKEPVVTYTVTFKVGTTTVATKTVEDGKTVTAPTAPTQSGKTFLGWYTEGGQKYDFSKAVTDDITLIAKFKDNASGDVLLGDINGDGEVNAKDSNLLKQMLSGSIEFPAGSRENLAADINGDGEISAKDSNLIKQIISGL